MPSFFDKLLPKSHKKKEQEKKASESQPTPTTAAAPATGAGAMTANASAGEPAAPEPSYSIQPHPATSNDPKDLEGPQLGGGLNSNPEVQAFNTPGPYIPSADVLQGVEQPKTREELAARSAALNKQ